MQIQQKDYLFTSLIMYSAHASVLTSDEKQMMHAQQFEEVR